MSEEEKQAIEDIKERVEEYEHYDMATFFTKDIRKLFEIIETQQKQIEEYNKRLTPTPDNYVPIEYQMINYVDKRNYISKDKIKARIEFFSNNFNLSEIIWNTQDILDELEELLGEK